MTKPKRTSYRLPRSLSEEIAELAEFVAEDYCVAGRVEPSVIAKEKKITLSCSAYGDTFDGMLEHKSGRFHIYVNLDRVDRPDSCRARFTLGHELGHFFIDDHRNALAAGRVPKHPSRCEFESSNPVEVQADHFASNLLLPTTRFLAKTKRLSPGLAGIMRIADFFRTSITSTAIRYVSMGVRPSVVIKWNPDGFAWKWISEDAFQAGYRKTTENFSQLPAECPTRLALAGEPAPTTGYFERASTASTWFPFCRPGTYHDIILIEQSIRLGRFGTLTFLFPESDGFPERCD
jgi:hypothetical protein